MSSSAWRSALRSRSPAASRLAPAPAASRCSQAWRAGFEREEVALDRVVGLGEVGVDDREFVAQTLLALDSMLMPSGERAFEDSWLE
jgi:hypothetical protein